MNANPASVWRRGRIPPTAVTWLLICYAAVVAPHLFFTQTWVLFFIAAVLLWRAWIERTGQPLPGASVPALLAGGVFVGVWLSIGTIWGRDAGTALMLGWLSIKFVELRSRRDFILIILISYFLAMTLLLFAQTILTFLYVVALFFGITATLVQLYLAEDPLVPRTAALKEAGKLMAQALPLAIVLFFIFPRVQGQFGFNLGQAKLGLNDTLKPGAYMKLVNNDEPAFRADLEETDQIIPALLYWRAFVLWEFNGEMWSQGGNLPQATTDYRPAEERGMQIAQRITILSPHGKRWLFALDFPIRQPTPLSIGRLNDEGSYLVADHDVNRKIEYRVVSLAGSSPTRYSKDMEAAGLKLPYDAISPRVAALARSWRDKAAIEDQAHAKVASPTEEDIMEVHERVHRLGVKPLSLAELQEESHRALSPLSGAGYGRNVAVNPQGIVEQALLFFRRGGFSYTTDPGSYEAHGMLDEFLFKRRRGYCEHYASAFVVLMRAAGVPSRVVAGYQGGEYNAYGKFYYVRQSCAHAWCEVWYGPERGWERVDVTQVVAPERITSGVEEMRRNEEEPIKISVGGNEYALSSEALKPDWYKALQQEADLRYQYLEERWDRWVLGYDAGAQLSIASYLGLATATEEHAGSLAVLGLVAIAFLAWLYLRFLRRRGREHDPLADIFDEYCITLSRAGIHHAPWEGPATVSARAAHAHPRSAPLIQEFSDLYCRWRYGRKAPGVEDMRELRELLGRLAKALRKDGARIEPLVPAGSK